MTPADNHRPSAASHGAVVARSTNIYATRSITASDQEGPYEEVVVSVIIAAAGGGATDLKTTLAMTSSEMKNASRKPAAPRRASGRRAQEPRNRIA